MATRVSCGDFSRYHLSAKMDETTPMTTVIIPKIVVSLPLSSKGERVRLRAKEADRKGELAGRST